MLSILVSIVKESVCRLQPGQPAVGFMIAAGMPGSVWLSVMPPLV